MKELKAVYYGKVECWYFS